MAGLTQFTQDDIVLDTQRVVTSTWSNNTNNLTTSFSSSTQAVFGSATSSGVNPSKLKVSPLSPKTNCLY